MVRREAVRLRQGGAAGDHRRRRDVDLENGGGDAARTRVEIVDLAREEAPAAGANTILTLRAAMFNERYDHF